MHLKNFGERQGGNPTGHETRTGTEHVDEDDDHHTYRDPNCRVDLAIPISYENCGSTAG